VQSIATRELGLAVVALGGGRTRPQDPVDPAVGLTGLAGIGERVDRERPLALVHARSPEDAAAAAAALRGAYRLGEGGPASRPLILDRLGAAA
jgi:thymidine phosphorylase